MNAVAEIPSRVRSIPNAFGYDPLYPDQDGKVSDNTEQFRWVMMLIMNFEAIFANNPNVVVAADNLIYAVEGDPKKRTAPDIYVAFGRPKGYRGSYQVWKENEIFPQVVMEIISPGNRQAEMLRKFKFYERYGAEEYYLIDPTTGRFEAYFRSPKGRLRLAKTTRGLVSPRLKVRFDPTTIPLSLFKPNGEQFLFNEEFQADREKQIKLKAEAEAMAIQERKERQLLEARLKFESQSNAHLRDKLRAAGIDPDAD